MTWWSRSTTTWCSNAPFEEVGRRYRRFPHRYTGCGTWQSTVDSDRDDEDVCVLKMHGSVDWVSRRSFERQQRKMRESNGEQGAAFSARRDPVFGPQGSTTTRPLVEGPRPDDDRLGEIHVIDNLDAYYRRPLPGYAHPPFLLVPAHTKQLYGAPLRDFWDGLPRPAFAWGGLSIIGYSLPEADPYARQVLYQAASGYVAGRNDPGYLPGWMNKIVVVDRRPDLGSKRALQKRYRFLDRAHTRFVVDGFTEESLGALFAAPTRKRRRV